MAKREDPKWNPLEGVASSGEPSPGSEAGEVPSPAGGAGDVGGVGGAAGGASADPRVAKAAGSKGRASPSGRGSGLGAAGAPLHLRQRIRALPGTLTYLDLIRKNKRDSVLLMVVMIALGVVFGAVMGGAIVGYTGGYASWDDPRRGGDWLVGLAPGLVMGAVVALVVASAGALWSWHGGANAILRMAHARPLQKEADPELYNVVDEMRIAAGIPMPKIYVIGDTAMNAFATGRDPKRGVVAITQGLREKLTRDELQGVIAHEIAHIRHYDIRFAMLMATMVGLIAVVADGFLRSLWYGRHVGRRTGGGRGGGGAAQIVLLALALLLAILAPIAARVIQMAYSRRREYLADAGAAELTRNPEGLASALLKLADDEEPQVDTANRGTAHMYIVNPLRKMRRSHQRRSSMFASHPPVQERVARLLALTR